jgi:hypothetical protein
MLVHSRLFFPLLTERSEMTRSQIKMMTVFRKYLQPNGHGLKCIRKSSSGVMAYMYISSAIIALPNRSTVVHTTFYPEYEIYNGKTPVKISAEVSCIRGAVVYSISWSSFYRCAIIVCL